jgi:hypothetical protein
MIDSVPTATEGFDIAARVQQLCAEGGVPEKARETRDRYGPGSAGAGASIQVAYFRHGFRQ